MRRFLPPLNALRAFDAAGRLLSFSKAAQELHVTQGAISRQIRELEAKLGAKLFVRLTRRIELTQVGEAYLQEVQEALQQIERATLGIRARRERRVLTISVLPSVGSYWLMPRLAGFTKAHPNIETRILTSIEPADLSGREIDVAIRVGPLPGETYGRNHPRIDLNMVTDWRGVHADFLFPDILLPVCSKALLGRHKALNQPADVQRFPLIHTATRQHAWEDWLLANGVGRPNITSAGFYGHFFMSIQAAREAQGIAIAPQLLFWDQRGDGLFFPFRVAVPSAGSYNLLALKARLEEKEIHLFRSWLLQEAERQNASDPFFPAVLGHAAGKVMAGA